MRLEPAIVHFSKIPCINHKPVITTQNSELAKLRERELLRLWLQINADYIDMKEAGLIIMQIAQALKPKLG